MFLILQQNKPDDFVIATGTTTSVRDFVKQAFYVVGVNLRFEGKGINEIVIVDSINKVKFDEFNINSNTLTIGDKIVYVDPKYFRPTEVDLLIGDPSKAKSKLGWKPKYDLAMLIEDMVKSDVRKYKLRNES